MELTLDYRLALTLGFAGRLFFRMPRGERVSIRFYLSTDESHFSQHAASMIQKQVTGNLRRLLTKYAFDFNAFNIAGALVHGETGADLATLMQRIAPNAGHETQSILHNARILIAHYPVPNDNESGLTYQPALLVSISNGENSFWGPGTNSLHANIQFSRRDIRACTESAVTDIFSDIMIANGAVVSDLRRRYMDSNQSTPHQFYKIKAQYAARHAAATGNPLNYQNYSPGRYASFTSLARKTNNAGPRGYALSDLARIWDGFITEYLAEHFHSSREAADLITKGTFRRSSQRARDAAGQNVSKKQRFGWLSPSEVSDTLSDKRIVREPGAYVLLISNRTPTPDQKNEVGPVMGWKSQQDGTVKQMRLVKAEDYKDSICQLVATGAITPIRLYLNPSKDV